MRFVKKGRWKILKMKENENLITKRGTKEFVTLGLTQIKGTLSKMTVKKKVLLWVMAFLLSFVVQALYLNVNYESIMEKKGGIIGTIGETVGMAEEEGNYQPTSNEAIVHFDWDGNEISQTSQVFLKFWEPVGEELLLTFFYATEGREVRAIDSVEIEVKIEDEWGAFPLNKAEYTTFSLYILNRPDVVLPIECIYLLEEPVTLLEEWESKISVFSTILFTLLLYGVFLLIFTYPSFFKEYAGFICLGLFYFYFLSKRPVYFDDVTMFMDESSRYNFWEYTSRRYLGWSSRQVIEAVLYYLVYHRILWAIITTFLCILTCYSMSRFVNEKSEKINWLVTLLFCMYPFNIMAEVGWIATSTNYLWPMAFIMYTMVGVKKCLDGKTLGKGEILLYCMAALYGGNQEQGASLLVGLFFLFFLYFKYKKLAFGQLYPVCVVSGLGFVHHLLCPGNSIRSGLNANVAFPSFDELSLLTKIEMGYSGTFFPLIMEYDAIFTLICILVFFVAAAKQNMKVLGCIAVPLAVTALFASFSYLLAESQPWIFEMRISGLTKTGTNPDFADPQSLLPLFFITIAFVFLLLGVYLTFEDKVMGLFNVIVLLAGFASRMIMGLSPSIWISGERTFIFMYFCFLVSAIFVYLELEKTKNKQYIQLVQGVIVLCAVVNLYYVLTDPYAYMTM